jgi:hypothetical protein
MSEWGVVNSWSPFIDGVSLRQGESTRGSIFLQVKLALRCFKRSQTCFQREMPDQYSELAHHLDIVIKKAFQPGLK